jgi:diadenylate cyclase
MFGPLALTLSDVRDAAPEIAVLFLVIYGFLRFLRRSVAGGIVRGRALLIWALVIATFFAVRTLRFETLDWLLARAVPLLLLSLVIVFQPEFRHGLARLGASGLLDRFRGGVAVPAPEPRDPALRAVDEIVAAVTAFSGRRTGAIIALERGIDLGAYMDSGVRLDAVLRAETLDTIFTTETLLHDGAVIVRGDRIAAAGCLLPLTERPHLARRYGTRHRAAIGLSEQSDALVIVVSEESGTIHVAERGELEVFRDTDWLTAIVATVMAEAKGVARTAP